jgi:hypothetical protein
MLGMIDIVKQMHCIGFFGFVELAFYMMIKMNDYSDDDNNSEYGDDDSDDDDYSDDYDYMYHLYVLLRFTDNLCSGH